LIITINQFWKNPFIIAQMMRITILAITFGAITFWRNRERVEQEIEDEKVSEEEAEIKRAKEFDRKFSRLSWFNFSYGIKDAWEDKRYFISILRALVSPFIWFARLPYSFVKWMYKEGWWYSCGLIIIVILGFVLRIWNLNYLDGSDNYTIASIKNWSENGVFFYPYSTVTSWIMFFLLKSRVLIYLL